MWFSMYSKRHGKTLTFSRPGKHYIYVDMNNQPGTLGLQICEGGQLMGSTMTYSGDDPEAFERICRRWQRLSLRSTR